MAVECFQGSIPLSPPHSTSLPLLPVSRCTPDEGICFSSLTHGGGQTTAQVSCWPRQTNMQLAWLGLPECKNEIGRLICICLESLCNGFLPSVIETSPEGTDLQALAMFFLVLVLLVMLVGVQKLVKKQTKKKVREDVEGVGDNTANKYMQKSDPYNNLLPSPPQYSGSPAPLLQDVLSPCTSPKFQAVRRVDREFHWDQVRHEHHHAIWGRDPVTWPTPV